MQPPKFGSLDALRDKDREDSDEDEQKFFVGGVGKGGGGSGQVLLCLRVMACRHLCHTVFHVFVAVLDA